MKQNGRSMVEMLGVLAIIGVLSIGGISGYTIAMNHYRTNETLNDLNTRAIMVASQIATNGALTGGEYALEMSTTNPLGQTVHVVPAAENTFMIQVSGLSSAVCRQIVNQGWDVPLYVSTGGDFTELDTADDCGNDTIDVGFEFANDLSALDTATSGTGNNNNNTNTPETETPTQPDATHDCPSGMIPEPCGTGYYMHRYECSDSGILCYQCETTSPVIPVPPPEGSCI